MNNFFADHWNDRYKYLTQCSEGNPFIRKVRGEEVKFTDPVDLIKYLKTSKDAEYMWSDSEDLAILSDMYQIRIKIITTKGENEKNPTVNWIHPDKSMAKYAEIKCVEFGEMVLLHQNDMHFNLIIPGDSDLATLGSLSYRFNIGPIVNKDIESEENKDKCIDKEVTGDIEELRKQLKKCKEHNRELETNYVKCEKELRILTT